MIENIRIQRFKSYNDAMLSISQLTVLVGANASGKSNALEALRLLSWIAKGNKLNAAKYASQEGGSVVRGRVRDLPNSDHLSFSFSCHAPFSAGSGSPHLYEDFSIELATTEDDELFIVDERVTGLTSTVPLYEVIERHEHVGHDVLVAYNNFARGGIKPKVACMDQQAVFIQLESTARYASNHKVSQRVIPHVSEKLQAWLGGIHFIDPAPSSMRGYSFKTENAILQDGSNLSGVLFNICERVGGEESVLDFIKSLPEQDIQAIRFVETPRGEVMVALVESFGGNSDDFDATLLSDGTLRVLAIAAAMLSAEQGALVVIEEIDNGVHPSRANMLLSRIAEVAKDRDLRVILSSHNPALLDALPDEALSDVVFCYRDPASGCSQLVKLDRVEKFPEIVAQGTLGDLVTKGTIERYVKSKATAASRRNLARKWLSEVR